MIVRQICLTFLKNRTCCEDIANDLKSELKIHFNKETEINVSKHVDPFGNETGAYNIMLQTDTDVAFYFAYGFLCVNEGHDPS